MTTTIGIFAHVDAGKTTLSEQLLYSCGTIRQAGRVDKKNTFLDYNDMEKSRGITIFADEAHFQIGENKYCIIDTPGHMDFSGEMERSILAIDCAVLVISSVEGVQSHTETIWKLLKKHNKPFIIFLNKIDREAANPDAVISYIKDSWKCNIVNINSTVTEENVEDDIIEEFALYDDDIMNDYLAGTIDAGNFIAKCKKLVNSSVVYPVIKGSALNGTGIELLKNILSMFFNDKQIIEDDNDNFSGVVYKVRHDKNNTRITFIKVIKGTLKPRDEIKCIGLNNEETIYKINNIRQYNGHKSCQIQCANAGDLCAVTGLSDVKPGDIIGKNAEKGHGFSLIPLMSARVIYDKKINIHKMLSVLKQIEDEEMLLNVSFNEELQNINIEIMGEMQLETLKMIVKERFDIDISFGDSEILYRETINNKVVGCGHFEPLRHYAEVHLMLEKGDRGSGITFNSVCPVDILSQNYQNLIRTHVFEKQHKGVLTGSPVIDIKITLLSGRSHIKHTEGGDFREAVYRAIRHGLMYAESILLEPWFNFEIRTDDVFIGRVLIDIKKLGGEYESPECDNNIAIIKGRCPVKTMHSYVKEFMIFTKGTGRISLNFDGYYPCSNSEYVIAEKNYNPEADVQNTADSVFCSHGSGYVVKWNEAKEKMHLTVEETN